MRQDVEHLDLVKHVSCSEVLQQFEPARCTKLAGQAAPHLRTDARRQTFGGWDQHPFDDPVGVTVNLEGALDRAVFAVLGFHLIDPRQRKRRLQFGTKPFAQ